MDDIVATCHGLRVPATPMISPQDARWIENGGYEGREIDGALHVTTARDRVLELGTGLGIVSAVVALNRQPQAVLTCEANPDLLPYIRHLHRVNRLDHMITAENVVLCGAGPRPAHVDFNISKDLRSSSLLPRASAVLRQIKVPTAGFAETAAQFRPSVLIMDIEGGELALLRGVDLSMIRAVVVEFHPGIYGRSGVEECKEILLTAGFAPLASHSTPRIWTCLR